MNYNNMSKTNIIEDIKNSAFNIIEEEYKNYLKSNKLLLIAEDKLLSIISDYYNNNSKTIKSRIREELKEKYKEEYKSSLVEKNTFKISTNLTSLGL